ncbi:hypothetical protein DFQ03_0139 [Maribacter caenipelagi]|uniref:Uncharacterized protein n=1 Tax=Maribacter caenipelagi TaxID=1447781 RepID=A0A4R7DK17_9FLAO|nr:tail fiber protein [Maribacter caenipelagi]TDS20881.1 hypothetical protein DFQ03_0139 [Maribacter caenipelagi]
MSLKNSLFTLIGVCLFLGELNAQNNLIDPSSWTVGSGAINGFTNYGLESENERIQYTDPYGNSSVIWMAKPEGGSSNSADGGCYSPYITIDPSKTYRYSIWMKKTGNTIGSSYFGLSVLNSSWSGSILLMDGTPGSNPYFWWGDLPELDKWYLIVGYVHPISYNGADLGGVYDSVTGSKVSSETVVDFKFGDGSVRTLNRGILFANNNNNTNRQYYWNPTIYEVNGQEPSIPEMLNPNSTTESNNSSSTSVWSETNSIASYTGKVGIGTTTPGNYELAVNGEIRAKEVKVETANWPDYVFALDYNLPSIKEVQQHILANGHLMNIPPAVEMETRGLELGEMNRLLLEKIEELTLYIIELKIQNDQQQEDIDYLKK